VVAKGDNVETHSGDGKGRGPKATTREEEKKENR